MHLFCRVMSQPGLCSSQDPAAIRVLKLNHVTAAFSPPLRRYGRTPPPTQISPTTN